MSLGDKVRRIKSKEFKVDKTTKKLFNRIDEIKSDKRQKDFENWLYDGIYLNDYDELDYITNLERVESFTDSIIELINNNGLRIRNNNKLKNELATFFYKLS